MRNISKKGNAWPVVFVLFFIVVVGALVYMIGDKQGWFDGTLAFGDTDADVDTDRCPDDGDTSLKIQAYNGLNDTGAEIFDVTGYLYERVAGSWEYVTSLTDTTAPSATTIDCGTKYRFCAVASNSDGGDHSVFTSVKSGDAEIDELGCAVFDADKSNVNINLNTEQHDVLKFRMFDNQDNRYGYSTNGTSNTVWHFESNATWHDGNNATAFAVSSGGYLDFCIELKGATTDEDFADAYTLVLIEAPLNKWDEPTVKFDGAMLSEVSSGGLTSYEQDQFSSYEYYYKLTGGIEDHVHELCLYMDACSGCDPTVDVEVDLASAGNFLSVDGITILQGGAKDDSANSVVYSVQDNTVDVS